MAPLKPLEGDVDDAHANQSKGCPLEYVKVVSFRLNGVVLGNTHEEICSSNCVNCCYTQIKPAVEWLHLHKSGPEEKHGI